MTSGNAAYNALKTAALQVCRATVRLASKAAAAAVNITPAKELMSVLAASSAPATTNTAGSRSRFRRATASSPSSPSV